MRAGRIEPPLDRLRFAVHALLRRALRLRWTHAVLAASVATSSACGGSSDASGEPPIATCGNGQVRAGEQCDDGNDVSGDGCSSTCFTEEGWRCEETLPSGRSTCARLPGAAGDSSEEFLAKARRRAPQRSSADDDINGDGRPDLVLNNGSSVVVIFGREAGFPAGFGVERLLPENGGDGREGFWLRPLHGAWQVTAAIAGDINGDGLADIVVGDPGASPYGIESAGRAFVVFGCARGFPAEGDLESLLPENGGDGSAGFVVAGIDEFEYTGSTVAAAGDVNGDGLDDLLIGATDAAPVAGPEHAGDGYLILGRRSAPCEASTLKPVRDAQGSAGRAWPAA
jgi:cysteine-rich repeat protein